MRAGREDFCEPSEGLGGEGVVEGRRELVALREAEVVAHHAKLLNPSVEVLE
jgi:hypothetical protein